MKKFSNYIVNRTSRHCSNCLNKLLDRKFKKINKDIIDMDRDLKGMNNSIHTLYMRNFDLQDKDAFIEPHESRLHNRRMYDEIEKILERHKDMFEALDDD